jgi:hypothetical protein
MDINAAISEHPGLAVYVADTRIGSNYAFQAFGCHRDGRHRLLKSVNFSNR